MNFVNTAKGDAYRLSSCKICEHYKSLFNIDHSPIVKPLVVCKSHRSFSKSKLDLSVVN